MPPAAQESSPWQTSPEVTSSFQLRVSEFSIHQVDREPEEFEGDQYRGASSRSGQSRPAPVSAVRMTSRLAGMGGASGSRTSSEQRVNIASAALTGPGLDWTNKAGCTGHKRRRRHAR